VADPLTPLGRQVRAEDHDRYLTLVFAPLDRREALFALHAFNQEIARTAEKVSEPLIGQMRLTWWRDGIEALAAGRPAPEHPGMQGLAGLLAGGRIPADSLLALAEARGRDLDPEPFAELSDLIAYCRETGGALNRLHALELEASPQEQDGAEALGTAFGVVGLLRNYPAFLARGRVWLPEALLREAGTSPARLRDEPDSVDIASVARPLVAAAEGLLRDARQTTPRLSRGRAGPLLLGTLTRRYLAQLARLGYRLDDPRVTALPPDRIFRLVAASLRGRW